MKKRKFTELIVTLAIRSASILSALTIIAISLGGCAAKTDANSIQPDASISISSEDKEKTTTGSDETTTGKTSESTAEKKDETIVNNQAIKTNINKTDKIEKPPMADNPNKTSKPITNNNNSNDDGNNEYHNENPTTAYKETFIPLTKNNINDIPVFERAVMEVSKKTRGGFGGVWYYNYDQDVYESFGLPVDEMKYILAALNSDYISNETLNCLLGEYSKEEIKRFYRVLSPMIGFVGQAECTNNWDGLILNSKTLKEFKDIEKAFLDCKYNNNQTPLRELLNNYNPQNSNPLVGYYLSQACDRSNDDKDDQIYINQYLGLYFDMKEECESLAENMYNKSHQKAKASE